MRYRGQNWSLPVEWPEDMSLDQLVDRFEEAHEQMYGTRLDPGSPVDVRALRLVALGPEEHAFSLAHDWEAPSGTQGRRLRAGPRHARGAGSRQEHDHGRARRPVRC